MTDTKRPSRRKTDVATARQELEELLHCAPDTCNHCRDVIHRFEVAVRGNRERRDMPRGPATSWVSELGDMWLLSRGGEPNYGRMGRCLTRLVKKHGLKQVRAAWGGYLEDRRERGFCQPEDFAASYGLYASKWAVETNDDGEWVPIPDEPAA